jgi:hypothetical protein
MERYEFDKALEEMTLVELAQEFSNIEYQQNEGYEYSRASLNESLEKVTKELEERQKFLPYRYQLVYR